MKSINIIITDPLRLLREGINALISVDAEIECTGEANDSISLLNILSRQIPDVILIGPNVLDIINTIEHISKNFPKSEIIIISLVKDPYFIYTCKEIGVCAYLHGDVGKEELIFAIRKAGQGQKYFNHEIEILSKKGFEEKRCWVKLNCLIVKRMLFFF